MEAYPPLCVSGVARLGRFLKEAMTDTTESVAVERRPVDPELVDRLLADAGDGELLSPDGLLSELTKAVMERALGAELTDHLGYERGDRAGYGSGNSCNGA